MCKSYFLFILLGLSLSLSCRSQTPSAQLTISIPTIEQEATSVWRTINDIEFLENLGYSIVLPKHEQIDSLIAKSKRKEFGNQDYATIYQLLESDIYKETDYQAAKEKVVKEQAMLLNMLGQIEAERNSYDWDFKMFEEYDIVFTLYGSGGSYDPETGRVTLFTTPEGAFKKYQNPANTIIHEITHLGMETSIILKHKLPHGLKERLVDRFVFTHFGEQLPEYKVQNMGDPAIDTYLKEAADFERLDAVLKEYVK